MLALRKSLANDLVTVRICVNSVWLEFWMEIFFEMKKGREGLKVRVRLTGLFALSERSDGAAKTSNWRHVRKELVCRSRHTKSKRPQDWRAKNSHLKARNHFIDTRVEFASSQNNSQFELHIDHHSSPSLRVTTN